MQALTKERDERLKPRVIARWDDWVMHANGTIHHPQWKENRWTIAGDQIRLQVGDRWTISKLGDVLDCVNQFNIRFKLSWKPPE